MDDIWCDAANDKGVANAFKIWRRKRKFNLIIISQSFFEPGRHAVTIRDNCPVRINDKVYSIYSLLFEP